MCHITLTITILYLSIHHAHQFRISADKETGASDNNFDTLVFAQEWPVTYCKQWIGKTRRCVLPTQRNRWTVHGIWPRKANGKYTNFCNNSWVHEPEQIKSIESDLDQAWTNIFKENDAYEFWAHEWLKHGTCAAILEPFNSQFKYFSKGIEWNKKHSLLEMLEAAGIFPHDSKEYTTDVFVNAVKANTKRDPMVVCELIDGIQLLEELRICFDKQFNVVDCVPVVDSKTCDVTKSIIFPAKV